MRQRPSWLAVVLAAGAAALITAPTAPALAQAPPASKVTITGIVDNLYNFNRNQSMTHADFDITRSENEAYGRTRGRFDIIGEVGRAKAVLGLELDLLYGQTGAADSCAAPFQVTGCRADGTSGGFDADNDVRNTIELKWMYVEAPLPFLPFPATIRLGGQPYTITYKPGIFANSDFGGSHLDLAFTPNVKGSITFVQFEEKLTGTLGAPRNLSGPFRAEDIGFIGTLEITPFKGLNIKPIYSYQEIGGVTSALLRRGTGGLANSPANFPDSGPNKAQEIRHTIGADARWTFGPFRVAPTAFFQFGDREVVQAGVKREQDLEAWIVDVEAGWRLGPLNLEVRGMITSGNDASDNIARDTFKVYQPFQTGNLYWIGWGEAVGIGNIDYLTSLFGFSNALSLPAQPSYDRYGRIMFAVRATYSLTPTFSIYGIVTPMWTLEKVDTDGTAAPATGITPSAGARGDARYLGTGLTAGFTYRFAPGLTFDAVYGYLVAGSALDIAPSPGAPSRDAKDSQVATVRVRYAF
ncbi:MAG: hypothetical protein QN168_15105 [Armatimonadota bacterium]|nr:hypothetical protein [Armatimonadota bacterium]